MNNPDENHLKRMRLTLIIVLVHSVFRFTPLIIVIIIIGCTVPFRLAVRHQRHSTKFNSVPSSSIIFMRRLYQTRIYMNKLNEIIQISIILIRSYFKRRNIDAWCLTIDCMMSSHSFQVHWTWNWMFYCCCCCCCASVYLIRLVSVVYKQQHSRIFFLFFIIVVVFFFFFYCLFHDRII